MWSRITIAILIALSGMGCGKSARDARTTGILAPQQLELKHIYTSVPKRFSLDFTVDGAPLTNATYKVEVDPKGLGLVTLEVLPATPLGGGAWIEVTPGRLPGVIEATLRIDTPEFGWSVPVSVEILPQPICQADNECRISRFDPEQERRVVSDQPNGITCATQAISCLQQSSCQQGVCVTMAVEERPSNCAPNQPGTALAPAWSYRSNGRIIFIGTTDEDGAIYFLDCMAQEGKFGDVCDLVSLDASGVERWRTTGIMKSVPELETPRLMVVGTAVFMTVKAKNGDDAWTRIVDRGTGTVRQQSDTLAMTRSAVRLISHTVAVIQNHSVLKLDLDTETELLDRSLPDETIGSPLMSDGAGRLVGFSSQSLPPFMSPPLPPLHLFGMGLVGSDSWMVEMPRSSDLSILANFENQLLLTTPVIRSLSTGEVTQQVERTANLFDAVLLPHFLGLAVTDRALNGCQERLLQKFETETGAIYWRCRLSTPASTLHLSSRLIALDDGGAIVAVEMGGTPVNAALLAVDGDGSATLYESLPLRLSFTTDVTPTMVGSRWIVNGVDPTTSRESIMAFDVPGLHAATSGWITSGGRLSRDGTPLSE